MIKCKGRLWKTGNSYVLTVPKAIVESGLFILGMSYDFLIKEDEDESKRDTIS